MLLRPLLPLLAIAAGLAADPPAVMFRAEHLTINVRLAADGAMAWPDLRLGLIADQPRGLAILRLDDPRFTTVTADTGERLAVMLRPASRSQDVVNDRQASRDRAVRLLLDLSPPRGDVRRLAGLEGSVRVTLGLGPSRIQAVAVSPLPAAPVPVAGLDGVAVRVEDQRNGRVALVIPAALAGRLADVSFVDRDGAPTALRPPVPRPEADGAVRLVCDPGASGSVRANLAWHPDLQRVVVAVRLPPLEIPGGIPGIGEAGSVPPAQPRRATPKLPLHRAIHEGDRAAVDWLLLADRTQLAKPDADGLRPLHRAALLGREALVARLLELGADATVRLADGRTALALAVESGDAGCVRLLLRSADPREVAPATGWSLLHQAVNAGSAGTVRLLLDAGLDPRLEAKDGRTPIDLARDQSRWPLIRLMVNP